MTHRTFPICTSNMNAFETVLRVIQEFTKPYGISEVRFIGCSANSAIHGQAGKQIVKRLWIVHTDKNKKGTGATVINRRTCPFLIQYFLIHPEIKLHRQHRFMIGFIEFNILQVLHDGFLV